MRFPVDVSKLRFRVAVPPREDTVFQTGEIKKRPDGRPVMVVELLAMDGSESDQIRVRVPGPVEVVQDDAVTVTGLSCLHWSMEGGRSGLSFAADALVPTTPKASK